MELQKIECEGFKIYNDLSDEDVDINETIEFIISKYIGEARFKVREKFKLEIVF